MSIVYIEANCEACGGTFTKKHNAYTKTRCDACQKARDAQRKLDWLKTEKGKEYSRRRNFIRYHKDPEKERERNKAWKAANHDKVLENNRKWYWANHEKAKEICRNYARSERGILLRRQRDRAHLEHIREMRRKDYWNKHERMLLLKRLRYKIGKGDMLARLERDKILGRIKRCDRLHLSALKLPCGQYPSCHKCPQDQRRCG